MPLTPEDVRNKRFTPVRLREGYDMGEVDQFLDEVESELERLTGDNTELRTKLEVASRSTPPTELSPEPIAEPIAEPLTPPEPEPTPQVVEEQEPEPVVAPPRRTSVAEASGAAARLLEIAARNADEVVDDAKDQADSILAEAHTKSERLENESRSKADRLESDARARADKLDAETAAKRTQLFGEMERDRDKLTGEVEHLRAFEREYRSRLKNYFTAQLAQLEGDEQALGALPVSDDDHTPRRLKSLLGEDHNQS
ncbi:MAG: DivIVA domain-containing protein [Nocardioidaceae bacterium]|nr:DivIVA domain-containing protein [Nocardioidaceae bacterium]